MTLLAEIRSFPKPMRDVLETQFGIASAEAFFEHSVRNAAGIGKALNVPADELEQLKTLVEGHLSPAFVARCRQPVKKHARGVIVE
jgi:hypothetical protein